MNKEDFEQLVNLLNELEWQIRHNKTLEQIWHIIYRNSEKGE